jgi:hypothetical protein
MKNIKCYKYDNGVLSQLGIVDDFLSFSFSRSYSNIGEWTLVLDGNSLNAQRIKGTQIISVADGVAGLVYKCEENVAETGEYSVVYTGVELKGIASQRIVMPPAGLAYQSYVNKSPEYVIAQLITQQILTPSTGDRAINGSLAAYIEGAESISFNGRFDNVAEAIQTIANTYNVGWYADVQDGTIVWHIYRGVDRRKSQSDNSRMIISYGLDSFGDSSFANINLLPNVALVAGQGEGVDRAVTLTGSGIALTRSEVDIDARDIEDSAQLPMRGKEKLAEYGDALTYEATFSQQFINLYRNPFDLGDIGTIEDNRLAAGEVDFRLTEITEVYEGDKLRLDAIFGYDKKGLASAIKRTTGNTQALISAEGSGTNPSDLVNLIYPVGSIYISANSTSPATLFGGTWQAFGNGKALVGYDASDSDFNMVERTLGSKTHTQTVNEMPSHTHTQNSHNHTQDSHNHSQNSHNHTQDSHTHTQNSHNHSQNSHNHAEQACGQGGAGAYSVMLGLQSGGSVWTLNSTSAVTATNNATTATNKSTTATNNATTATNNATTATNNAMTATNQNTGGGAAFSIMQPSIVVYMWKRTA